MESVYIIGAGKSGFSAGLLARRKGFERVFVSESSQPENSAELIELFESNGIEYEFGKHSFDLLEEFDLVVTSPGVPPNASIITEAAKRGRKIIGEIEFASQFLENPIIAITGTNGKTTTTALVDFIFKTAGRKSVSAGNIGTPLSDFVDRIDKETVVVLEVSSYQLDRTEKFKPKVAVILNITPDHIKYHGDYESYRDAKFKIFANQDEKDLLILNFDDKETYLAKSLARGEVAFFGFTEVEHGVYVKGNEICLRFPDSKNEEVLMDIGEIKIPGVHNLYNSLAGIIAARFFEIKNEHIRQALREFSGVEHRLELVRKLDGVDYVNDSKATNVDAAYYALRSYNRPIVWIAGGRSDNNDYEFLYDIVEKNVKAIVAIGEARGEIFTNFCTIKRCYLEDTLEDAVRRAREIATPGDVVLFSPACKSFDMFKNFEHRGKVFKEIVNRLR